MNITKIIDDNNMTLCKCTDKENDDIDIIISPLFLIIAIIPSLYLIICVISFSMYSFIKVLIKKKIKFEYIQIYM